MNGDDRRVLHNLHGQWTQFIKNDWPTMVKEVEGVKARLWLLVLVVLAGMGSILGVLLTRS